MTKYEDLIHKSKKCLLKAREATNLLLKIFYANAAEGYKIKAGKLTVQEAGEQVK